MSVIDKSILITLLLLCISCQCARKQSLVLYEDLNSGVFDGICLEKYIDDSVLSFDFDSLSDEKSIPGLKGNEIEVSDVFRVINSDIGVCFPKGFRVREYDLRHTYLPHIHLFIAGRVLVYDNLDAFVIIYKCDKETCSTVYLVTSFNNKLQDAIIIAYVDKSYDECIPGPTICNKLSNNTFYVCMQSNGVDRDVIYYEIAEDGKISKRE